MKVAALALSAPPVRHIGSELMLLALLQMLRARGHDVSLFVVDVDDHWVIDGIPVAPFNGSMPAADVVVYQAGLGALLDGCPAPTVGIAHNARTHTAFDLLNYPPALACTNSRWSVRHLGRVDLVVHPPLELPATYSPGDRVTIVNLDGNKAGRFWELVALLPDVPFLAVLGGYGAQQVPDRIPSNVELVPHVPHDRMRELVWDRTGLLLAPSRHESWSMTASEALAHGIPVIASDLPGLRENIGPAGVLLPRAHLASWRACIRDLRVDPSHWSFLARQRAVEHHKTWLAESAAWVERVEEVAGA